MRAPTQVAVEHYLSSGYAEVGERVWTKEEIPATSYPFSPIAVRLRDSHNKVIDTLRSVETFNIEIEYQLDESIKGLRVGIYIMTTRGEFVFTSFDTDDADYWPDAIVPSVEKYISTPGDRGGFLNEGRYLVGINASSYRIKRYFQDEQAIIFNVDPSGAPGMQWAEPRLGPVRPRLNWQIETISQETDLQSTVSTINLERE